MDTALFSPSSLFQVHGGGDEGKICTSSSSSSSYFNGPFVFWGGAAGEGEEKRPSAQEVLYVERPHAFPGGMELIIREFSFHQLNANLLWPGTFAFSEWLVQNQTLFQGQRILELGSGTGALAIFLRRSFGVDITTSDFDDKEVEENIAHNCRANELAVLPHIRHTWGDTFPVDEPDWDLVIASDILLYVKQYPNLIKSLCFLLNTYKPKDERSCRTLPSISGKEGKLRWPLFLMSWRRRIGREDEALFFRGCENSGLVAEHVGSRVYCISPRTRSE